MSHLRLGVDVGQRADYTALCALQVVGDAFYVRQAGRLQLGTRWQAVTDTVVRAVSGMRAQAMLEDTRTEVGRSYPVGVYVDATGDRGGLAEKLAEALMDIPETGLFAITILAGDRPRYPIRDERGRPQGWGVGKEYLANRVGALLQAGRIQGDDTPELRQLIREVRAIEAHAYPRGFRFEARPGEHDDLWIALGLGVMDEVAGPVDDIRELDAGFARGGNFAAEAGLTVYQGVPLDASEAVDPVGGGDLASAGPYGWRF